MSLKRNAKENVECSIRELKQAKCNLEDALQTVEKTDNKDHIKCSLDAIDEALCRAEKTVMNYVEK